MLASTMRGVPDLASAAPEICLAVFGTFIRLAICRGNTFSLVSRIVFGCGKGLVRFAFELVVALALSLLTKTVLALTIRLHLRDEGIGLVADTGLATAIVCHCQVPVIRNR